MFDCLSDYLTLSRQNTRQYSTEETRPKTEEKATSIFSKICELLRTIYYTIYSALSRFNSMTSRNIFKGKLVTTTHNAGKSSDAPTYSGYKTNPYQVPKETRLLLAEKGYEQSPGYLDEKCTILAPKNDSILLSPTPGDGGKCTGGVAIFLKETSGDKIDINSVGQKFEKGVPREGVLHQELYSRLRFLGSRNFVMLDMWEKIKEKNLSINELPKNPVLSDENPREALILSAYLAYLGENISDDQDPIKWVDEYIQKEKNEQALSSCEKATLYDIICEFQYGTSGSERLALQTEGLHIEATRPTVISKRDTSPISVLNQIDDLEPGSYKLNFPILSGELHGVGHTIAFIVQEKDSTLLNGATIFYDPNYSITAVEKENNKETIEKVFKHYTGYSVSNDGLGEKIKNIWNGYASPPKNPQDLVGFELLKIKSLN